MHHICSKRRHMYAFHVGISTVAEAEYKFTLCTRTGYTVLFVFIGKSAKSVAEEIVAQRQSRRQINSSSVLRVDDHRQVKWAATLSCLTFNPPTEDSELWQAKNTSAQWLTQSVCSVLLNTAYTSIHTLADRKCQEKFGDLTKTNRKVSNSISALYMGSWWRLWAGCVVMRSWCGCDGEVMVWWWGVGW